MLWIALHLPHLPLQVFLRARPVEDALAVVRDRRILSMNESAATLGVRPGMSLPSAQALAPALILRQHNPRAEEAALAELAAWAGQFTPQVSLDAPDCVLLEVSASLRLFGGLESLLRQVAAGCEALGFSTAQACAPTPLAARLLARSGGEHVVLDANDLSRALAPLPIKFIDWAPRADETLVAIGAATLGDVLALPRAGLARRCGQELLTGLDRALGTQPDPRRWFESPETFSTRLEPLTPVEHTEAILFVARRLIAALAGFLAARQSGIERFLLSLEHEERPATRLMLSFAGWSRDEARFITVLRERLTTLELPGPVLAVQLAAHEIRCLTPSNTDLFDDARLGREKCAQLVERLRARLGSEAVSGVRAVPAHRPELAWQVCEPGAQQRNDFFASTRPLWLLEPPQPLEGRDGQPRWNGPLRLLAGPERIESGWWDGNDAARDYYVALGPQEEMLWLFRERRAPHGWYLHGLFA